MIFYGCNCYVVFGLRILGDFMNSRMWYFVGVFIIDHMEVSVNFQVELEPFDI
jgi:hypothetical protein